MSVRPTLTWCLLMILVPVGSVLSEDVIFLPRTPVLVEPDNTPVPSSEVIGTIKSDQWYVVESSVELRAISSPEKIVDIEAATGPVKVRGMFVDGTGKNETRTYTSPYIYFVTAKASGTTELILIPYGLMPDTEIVRQWLTVSGNGPQPPPEPTPPEPGPAPEPKPPEPVKAFRVIFVTESGQTLNAEQTGIPEAKAVRDYLNQKTTKENGHPGWRQFDPQQNTVNEQPAIKSLWRQVEAKITYVPCLVIQVNDEVDVLPYPANVADAIKVLQKAGGQ